MISEKSPKRCQQPACQLSILEPTVKDQHLAWSTIALSADDSAWYCAAIEALERDSSGRDRLALSACVLTVDGHLARAARSLSIRDGVASVRDVDATSSECQGCASGL